MESKTIRKKFLEFFETKGHMIVESSSLIPSDDPTLLFANAGMNQFKDIFLGKEKRSYTRAASAQKCIRAGGKHNDLDQVGFTSRHLTFFEMLGNFSFGDYFKREAIIFAWEFLVEVMKIDQNKLLISVFQEDDQTYELWKNLMKIPENKIIRLGERDNFWQMGETGPCGPCSEIYFDQGSAQGCGMSSCAPGCSCDRFLEIWNLVFMEFNRQADGTLVKLAQTGVDTGMGLERLTAIVQKKNSIFHTDIFMPIIEEIEKITHISYQSASFELQSFFHVLADHIRASSFALASGCVPSPEGRGYVIRKIIRRAILFENKLNKNHFFYALLRPLIRVCGDVYPELKKEEKNIETILKNETERFSQNVVLGKLVLERYIQDSENTVISGEQAFKLYDTYGFPLELTNVIAREHHFRVDVEGFEAHMEKQRHQSRKKIEGSKEFIFDNEEMLVGTVFTGYDETETKHCRIDAIIVDTKSVEAVDSGQKCLIITDKSPFYVECGGQVQDVGLFKMNDRASAPVEHVKKVGSGHQFIAHEIVAPCMIKKGDQVTLIVDNDYRLRTMKNHTATHLLQSALIRLLGKEVKQTGSLVHPDYLRFDFSYAHQINNEQLQDIECLINQKIAENIPVNIEYSTLDQAIEKGVIAFFGEKYNPNKVRVVRVTGFSSELCGGTHVKSTGDIGLFKIIEISSLSAGNRRIVALTGPAAVHYVQEIYAVVKQLSNEFKVQTSGIVKMVTQQKEQLKGAQQQIIHLKKELYQCMVPTWITQIEYVDGIPYGYVLLKEQTSIVEMREVATFLSKKLSGLYVLISQHEQMISLVITNEGIAEKISLVPLVESLKTIGIKGGVAKTMFQGGGMVAYNHDIKTFIKNHIRVIA